MKKFLGLLSILPFLSCGCASMKGECCEKGAMACCASKDGKACCAPKDGKACCAEQGKDCKCECCAKKK